MAVRFFATPAMRREPSASTRACSTASKTPRACGLPGISLRCTFGSWQASFSAMESACPRTMAASRRVILRAGSGSRALPGESPGRSEAKVTSSSGVFAIARKHDVTARLNGSVGASLEPVRNLELDGVVMVRCCLNACEATANRPAQRRDLECLPSYMGSLSRIDPRGDWLRRQRQSAHLHRPRELPQRYGA